MQLSFKSKPIEVSRTEKAGMRGFDGPIKGKDESSRFKE